MENLCLNPTRNTNVYAHTPVPNFSEQGLRFQRGYSHGYNILTGEVYSSEPQQGKTSKNLNIKPKFDARKSFIPNDKIMYIFNPRRTLALRTKNDSNSIKKRKISILIINLKFFIEFSYN